MRYKISDLIAANTTEKTAQEKRLTITHGVIVGWNIGGFDEGADLLHLKIFRGNHQLVPYNEDESIWPSMEEGAFREYYPVLQPPYELVCRGWNEDDSYPHLYWVNVTVLPEIIAGIQHVASGIVDKVRSFFGWD